MENEGDKNQVEIGRYIIYNQKIKNGLTDDYLAINNEEDKNYICKIIFKKELQNISLEEKNTILKHEQHN